MPMVVWGLLTKSAEDSQKIEEAIDAKISDHNADPDAHGLADMALYAHRSGDVLDHIAESVKNIKIEAKARAHIAIVDITGGGDYTDIQEAINYAEGKEGGIIFIRHGNYQLANDLQLKKRVDLIGEGPKETILDFQNAAKGIKGYGIFNWLGKVYSNVQWTNGSPIVTFPAGTTLIDDKTTAGMYVFDTGALEQNWLIASVDSQTQLTLSQNYTGSTHSGDACTRLYANWTNGSKIVTFNTGVNLISNGVVAEMLIIDEYQDNKTYVIDSVDSEIQLTITENYTGLTNSSQSRIRETVQPDNVLTDLGIKNSQADYAIDCPDGDLLTDKLETAVELNNIEFTSCKGIVRAYTHDKFSFIIGCRVYNCTGPILFDITSYLLRDNYFKIPGVNITLFAPEDKCAFINNIAELAHNYDTAIFDTTVHDDSHSQLFLGNSFFDVEVFDRRTDGRVYHSFVGNYLSSASINPLVWQNSRCGVVGNVFYGGFQFGVNSEYNTFVGNYVYKEITDLGLGNTFLNNAYTRNVDEKKSVRMTSSGISGLGEGAVVILRSTAAGDEVYSTTIKGDDKVFGMLDENWASVSLRSVLTQGKTTKLKVNGTDAIAIGDFLCTYTVAGISCKAGAGDMAFAIALEAYAVADSNGVLDALLITPRKL